MNDIIQWKNNENFSFKLIENQTINGEACPSSLFNGTIIRRCSWYDVDVNHSDIEAIKVYDDCLFENCIFSHTDIHSDYFSDTRFINVDFSKSSIVDCTFRNCRFIRCIFDESNMRESFFESCQLDECSLLHGSFLLNQFINCTFKQMTFKNVFYYTTMISCDFIDVEYEIYLLGYTYGLTPTNLHSLKYTYMGKKSKEKYEELYSQINKIYLDRHMYINSGILLLMDGNTSKSKAIMECYLFIGRYIQNNHLIKTEQMMFLFRITELMFDSKVLPPVMLWQIINIINQIKLINGNESKAKINESLLMIQSKLLARYYGFVDYLSKKLTFNINDKIYICVKYDNRPTIEMVKILNRITETNSAKQIKVQKGSFIEWIEGNQAIVTALGLFLEFLAVTVPISWDIYKEKHVSKKSDVDVSITINNNISKSYIPQKSLDYITKSTASIVNSALENSIGNTVNVIVTNNILDDDEMCGYNSKNIKEIIVSSKVE